MNSILCRTVPTRFQGRLRRLTRPALALVGITLGTPYTLATEPATNEPTLAESKAAPAATLKDLDGHFPFSVPASVAAWEERSKELKQQLEVSLGLFPRPRLAPVKPVVHSRREMDGYAIEKVYFESLPGFYVSGSLYTPTTALKAGERRPAVLCPHGHWTNGRFYYTSDAEARRELANGAERFESAAHSPLQARCVQMARMGIVVFHYDMMGNADCMQIGPERVHGFGNHGPNPDVAAGKWLLYSPKAEGLLQNIMGMQTLNTLQSLEFVLQRADVDPKRISITGASGGGTQTFIAAAIEPRFSGAYPVVMVSTSMQGGCTCENAVGLRVDTGNVEIAAMIAPRPLGVNAANDWTKNMANDGFPQLKQLYGLYNAGDKVALHNATHFTHNYNHVTRVPVYGFMNRLFGLGMDEPILERDFPVLKAADMTVWDEKHPQPKGGIEFEADLLARWAEDIRSQVQASPEVRREGWQVLLRPAERLAKELQSQPSTMQERFGVRVETWPIARADGTVVGELIRLPERSDANAERPVLRVIPSNHEGPLPACDYALIARDALGIDSDVEPQSLVKNPRHAACYTYGYNPPVFVRRLAVVMAALESQPLAKAPRLQAIGDGPQSALASAIAALRPDRFASVGGDPKGFDFDAIESIRDPNFLPGSIRFGGLAGLQSTAKELLAK
ncbi:MAG: alpha/beta hydrolase family protein [Pirellula sp.]